VKRGLSRRWFLPGAGIAATAGYATMQRKKSRPIEMLGGDKSAVAVVRANRYSADLAGPMLEAVRACGLDARGKSVLLKPNLVEFDHSTAINTDASVVAAAVEVFRSLGAASVAIGEGPGHRRDTLDLARQAGYYRAVRGFEGLFTDLNRDDVTAKSGFAGEDAILLPNTALRADIVVSLAKMKTHHWAGVTLSMKNLFGLVPGAIYGWPKNRLHYLGITRSILELNRLFRNTFAIVDGITGMEGNGPIQGKPKACGVLVCGRDLRAADATCCRIMGIDPAKVEHLREAAHLGHLEEAWIEQRGEAPAAIQTDFETLPQFANLRLGGVLNPGE
jgi:uncharacterized protein (DUF362 family)